MENKNMSDIIEEHLKELLANEDIIEIKRAELANQFNCVPSQINYVINTRFTIPKGYRVESKRGGGGYIRIVKVKLIQYKTKLCEEIPEMISNGLTESEAFAILNELHDNDIITLRERHLLQAAFKLNGISRSSEERLLRSNMMIAIIERLTYKEREELR
ncbi:CtsR family transcriptional regulator [Vagococcus martis]|uniref:Transcriptional regulator CtsR n=1 Tax=Vagococcus martis TaxID=1768210 RepID=A0A1V4DH41_9ENTE|nr:CtsR family transcriptional regulator [Vagococcus martis]